MAFGAFADPAGNPDRFKRVIAGQIQPVRIDEIAGVSDFAAQGDGIAPQRSAVAPGSFRDVTGQADVANTVRCFRQLPQESTGRLESSMHVPQGAGASETRKL